MPDFIDGQFLMQSNVKLLNFPTPKQGIKVHKIYAESESNQSLYFLSILWSLARKILLQL